LSSFSDRLQGLGAVSGVVVFGVLDLVLGAVEAIDRPGVAFD
jgi:hypothetical protein